MERLGSIDHGKDFAGSVEEIINQPLTVENIDTYAEAALDKLIQLIDDMVQAYDHQPTIWLDNPAQRENATFAYYGIEEIRLLAKSNRLVTSLCHPMIGPGLPPVRLRRQTVRA